MKIEGKIVRGKQLGRSIGFPTANLLPKAQWRFEKTGVWAAWFFVDGQKYPCMANIGRHPTVPDGPATIEAHLFDFSGELYGKDAVLETVQYLRGEVKFPNLQALQAQLALDQAQALHILTSVDID